MNDLIRFEEVYDHCEAMGLDIDTLTHEGGAAQMKLISIMVMPCLWLIRRCYLAHSPGAALNHDIHATFMAKPMQYQPGSSMHLHCSVMDMETNKNIFNDADGQETDAFRWAMAGMQTHLASGMPYGALVNSYSGLPPPMMRRPIWTGPMITAGGSACAAG